MTVGGKLHGGVCERPAIPSQGFQKRLQTAFAHDFMCFGKGVVARPKRSRMGDLARSALSLAFMICSFSRAAAGRASTWYSNPPPLPARLRAWASQALAARASWRSDGGRSGKLRLASSAMVNHCGHRVATSRFCSAIHCGNPPRGSGPKAAWRGRKECGP